MSISTRSVSKTYVGPLSPEYPLLGLLVREPAHGYQLYQSLQKELGHIWHISLSQTYNILNRLEKSGLITGRLQEQSKRPARRRFSLTKQGRNRFQEWLQEPSGLSVKSIRIEFTTRLYFAFLQDPDLAVHMVEEQIQETKAGIYSLSRSLKKIPPDELFNRLSMELRLRHLQSTLEWLYDCRNFIRKDNSP